MFEKIYGKGQNVRLSKAQALSFLRLIRKASGGSYDNFYPAPGAFLDQAVEKSKDHIWNQINNY